MTRQPFSPTGTLRLSGNLSVRSYMECPFCPPKLEELEVIAGNGHCLLIEVLDQVLVGSVMVIPKNHRENASKMKRDVNRRPE